jgi:formiminoglutamase
MTVVSVRQGHSPVILAFPHTSTQVPADVHDCLNDRGRTLSDTDWHVDRLYAGLLPDATTVTANFHRYVIDANRDPTCASLYPGQNTTGLVPMTDFDGAPIWQEGRAPDAAEIERRRQMYHAPYHAALAGEVERIRKERGVAVLYDCHSIRGTIPFLFEGRLPDLNVGTDGGRTCSAAIGAAIAERVARAPGLTSVINGRFKGGWTTRHYGRPAENVHAVQMELAQATHLATEAPPFAYDEAKASALRPVIREILERIEAAALSRAR